jgi:hypothetical protein
MSMDASTARSLTAPGRGLQDLPAPTWRTGVRLRAAAWLIALLVTIAAGVLVASSSTTAPVRRVTPSIDRSTSGTSWAQVPPLAQLAISRALGADNRAYWATSTGPVLATKNISQQLSARYSASGVAVSSRAGGVDLNLLGISGVPAMAVNPTAHANRITYARGAVSEWYANGPMGLEQSFSVARPQTRSDRALTIALALGGSLRARMQSGGRGISLIAPDGKIALRYGRLSASDSTGRALPVSLALHGHRVVISVATAGAHYPVTVDPLLEEGQLSATNSGLGSAVAIEGSTIVVGAPSAVVGTQATAQGAVYVFTKPAGGWANATQTAELIASDGDENLEYNVYGYTLGSAVAISDNTIVASAPRAPAGGALFAGKIYVFVKPAGEWVNSTENAQLSASDASDPDYLGSTLAISGKTVVAGEPDNNGEGDGGAGALYVFSEPAGGWKSELETAKLTDNGSAVLGSSVAVQGSTIVGGAAYTTVEGKEGAGALYEYTEPEAGGWKSTSSPTAALTSGGPADESLGTSVALEGSTLVAGAANNFDPGGAPSSAYVFAEPKAGWETTKTPVARLTPSDPLSYEHFGGSIAISGTTIAVGAQFAPYEGKSEEGAVYLYSEPAGGWATTDTQTQKLAATNGNVQQAGSVALSGSTLVESAPYAKASGGTDEGAAYVFGSDGAGAEEGTKGTGQEPAPAKEITFAKPAENTKLTYVSTAPPIERETFIGFPLNVKPGEPIACIGNVCTYAAIKCKKAKEPCIGSASYEEISGALASSAAAKSKKKLKKKPVVYGKGSFSIPAGTVGKITIKLTAAGRKLLKGKKHARGRLTITTSQPSGKSTTNSSIVTIKLASKHGG